MSRSRRLILALLVLAVAAIAAYVWWPTATDQPIVRLPDDSAIDDPAVKQAAVRARNEVVAHPGDANAWGNLGLTYLANSFLDPAHPCFVEASRLDPDNPRWPYLEGVSLLLRDPRRGGALLAAGRGAIIIRADGGRRAARWAESLIAADRFDEAESVLVGALAINPNDVRIYLNLGILEGTRDRRVQAIAQLRKCLDHPSARRRACLQLAALLTADGKTAEAAEFARRGEDLPADADWPDPFMDETASYIVGRESLFIQAEKMQQQGRLPQAADVFRDVIRLYPDEARAYAKLGFVLAQMGQYDVAESTLRTGLEINADMVQCHYFLAIAQFNQAERLGFGSTGGNRKLTEALASATRATELKPDHGFAHLYRGLALKNLGRKAEALAALREAVRCTPDATDPHLHLGQALFDDGQIPEATAELETAVLLAGPSDQRAKKLLDQVRKAPGKS